MFYLLAPFIGVLITLMNAVNSAFAAVVGNLQSAVVIHAVGLIAVCLILAVRPERKKTGKVPFYLYGGGIVGVGTVLSCNVAYGNLGAALAVSLALFGQTAFSVVVDATGLLGRKKYPVDIRTVPGLMLAAVGIFTIAGGDFRNARYAPVAVLSGALPVLSFILNSQLAGRVGVFRSTRANYITGLTATLAVVAIVAAATPGMESSDGSRSIAAEAGFFLSALTNVGPGLLLGGGLMGVLMVCAVNVVFPQIPALYSSLLMFAGQALAGVGLDSALGGVIELRKLFGTLIVLAGLGANALIHERLTTKKSGEPKRRSLSGLG